MRAVLRPLSAFYKLVLLLLCFLLFISACADKKTAPKPAPAQTAAKSSPPVEKVEKVEKQEISPLQPYKTVSPNETPEKETPPPGSKEQSEQDPADDGLPADSSKSTQDADQTVEQEMNMGQAKITAKPLVITPIKSPNNASSTSTKQDIKVTTCLDASKYVGKSLQDLQAILHEQAKSEIATKALSGNTTQTSSQTNTNDAQGSTGTSTKDTPAKKTALGNTAWNDPARGRTVPGAPAQSSFTPKKTVTNPSLTKNVSIFEERFYNGKTFAQLCVEAHGQMGEAGANLTKQHVALDSFCYTNASVSAADLKPHALVAAMQHILAHFTPALKNIDLAQARKALTNISIAQEHQDEKTNSYCMSVSATYDPVEALNLVPAPSKKPDVVKPKPKDQTPPTVALDLSIQHVAIGEAMKMYGDAIAVLQGSGGGKSSGGKGLGLNGTTNGELTIDGLHVVTAPTHMPTPVQEEGLTPRQQEAIQENPIKAKSRLTFMDHNLEEFTSTFTLAYDFTLTQDNIPLALPVLSLIYADYSKDTLGMTLNLDETKQTTMAFDANKLKSNTMPYPGQPANTKIMLQKQNNTLKIYVNGQFITSVVSPNRRLRLFTLQLAGHTLLYDVTIKGTLLPLPVPIDKSQRKKPQSTMKPKDEPGKADKAEQPTKESEPEHKMSEDPFAGIPDQQSLRLRSEVPEDPTAPKGAPAAPAKGESK